MSLRVIAAALALVLALMAPGPQSWAAAVNAAQGLARIGGAIPTLRSPASAQVLGPTAVVAAVPLAQGQAAAAGELGQASGPVFDGTLLFPPLMASSVASPLPVRLAAASAPAARASGSSIWRLPAGLRARPGQFPLSSRAKLRQLARWDAPPVALMQGSWILGGLAAVFIGYHAILVFGALFTAGLLWSLIAAMLPKARAGIDPELGQAALAAWQALAPASRKALEASLGALRTKTAFGVAVVDHPFLLLVHWWPEARRDAYGAAAAQLQSHPGLFAPLLGKGLRRRLQIGSAAAGLPSGLSTLFGNASAKGFATEEDTAALAALGPPGARELIALLGQRSFPGYDATLAGAVGLSAARGDLGDAERRAVAQLAQDQNLSQEARAILREIDDRSALEAIKPKPAAALSQALERADARIASLDRSLPATLAKNAISEAVKALEAARDREDRQAEALALNRLETLLGPDEP